MIHRLIVEFWGLAFEPAFSFFCFLRAASNNVLVNWKLKHQLYFCKVNAPSAATEGAIAFQQEGPGFKSWPGVFSYGVWMFSTYWLLAGLNWKALPVEVGLFLFLWLYQAMKGTTAAGGLSVFNTLFYMVENARQWLPLKDWFIYIRSITLN